MEESRKILERMRELEGEHKELQNKLEILMSKYEINSLEAPERVRDLRKVLEPYIGSSPIDVLNELDHGGWIKVFLSTTMVKTEEPLHFYVRPADGWQLIIYCNNFLVFSEDRLNTIKDCVALIQKFREEAKPVKVEVNAKVDMVLFDKTIEQIFEDLDSQMFGGINNIERGWKWS